MDSLNKDILHIALPSILANITIPLVGMVDIAVGGHLPPVSGLSTAAYIGGLTVGSMLFDLLYWNFYFLRISTGGLTAQAYGRKDSRGCAVLFARSTGLALTIAALLLCIQLPFTKLALLLVNSSAEVVELALKYFFVRVWAAPATVTLMSFKGWFIGMQDSASSMWTDLTVSITNITASIVLAMGAGSWEGLGFDGIAAGTVIAQYTGLAFASLRMSLKYGHLFKGFGMAELKLAFRLEDLRSFFSLNANLFIRSIALTSIYIGFTCIAALFGDLMLACASIMMKLLMIFSYFTDGYAYAGEALTGRYIGENNPEMTRRSIKYVFVWSMSIAFAFIFIYLATGEAMLRMMTSDSAVIDACREFLPWLVLMPPLGCAAFTWDGIYEGATASVPLRNSMLWSTVLFFAFWYAARAIADPHGPIAIHVLLAAYFLHLVLRTVYLSAKYRKSILLIFERDAKE